MDCYEVMRTTFSAREFTGESLPNTVLYEILDHARFAPSGGNRQGGRVIIVRNQATKDEMARLAEPASKRYAAQVAAGDDVSNPGLGGLLGSLIVAPLGFADLLAFRNGLIDLLGERLSQFSITDFTLEAQRAGQVFPKRSVFGLVLNVACEPSSRLALRLVDGPDLGPVVV